LLHLGGGMAGIAPNAGNLPSALLHAPVMLLIVYPAFIFGFLLTVFPRWMGQPDLRPAQFGPVAVGLALGSLAVVAGLWSGELALLHTGFLFEAGAWALAMLHLAATIRANRRAEKPPCWHAVSALLALVIGWFGLVLAMVFLLGMDPRFLRLANVLALSGFILPVFLTVAHRMVPFFAGNVVAGYERWRPDWLLVALWALLALRMGGEALLHPALSVLASAGLAAVTGLMAWKWWPRGPAPGLLKVLVWGFAWAPAGFALAALAAAGVPLGLAPTHALALGFAGSLMVAMVTRVTQGHSGRPLAMTRTAWFAFAAIQLALALRVMAALRSENALLLAAGSAAFALGLLPWVIGNARIYLTRRKDGKPG
jgi:uncharacterized protein involved in response to NO